MKKKLFFTAMVLSILCNAVFGVDYVINVSRDNKEYADLLFKGYDYYKIEDYESAVNYYERAYDVCSNPDDCEIVENILVSVYYLLANDSYNLEDYENTIKRYEKLLDISPNEFNALINIGIAYIWDNPELALSYFQKAKRYARNQRDIELADDNIQSVKEILENFDEFKEERNFKALNKTNDTFVYKQYYLYYLDVFKAREKIPNNDNIVTIAIIDDGIKFDHPDLKNSIWTNKSEKLNGIDDDNNGYVDDYYGWNFVKNSNDITPIGTHGTMIAGIVGATSNNGDGIAGIIPNGKIRLMSLIIFGLDGKAKDTDTVAAINYAIDNGADIINLSLGGEEYQYSDIYNEAIRRANDKGIVIVVAAGNGDESQNPKVGINTTNVKLSPVCNGDFDYSVIGVGSIDKTGDISSRSNCGDCIDVYTYGESIFSTSSTGETLYAIGSGTSFSTPIVAGIIGLGYLKYGKIGPSNVYYALKGSMSGNNIDVGRYLENLGKSNNEVNYKNDSNLGRNNTGNNVKFSSDLEVAIQWMYQNGLTIYDTPKTFMTDSYLTREQASKFFVQFATTVLQKDKPNIESYNLYTDINNADSTLKDFIIYASNMGLFKGFMGKFMPFNNLSQAQALTVTVRMLDGYLDETPNPWYVYYFYRAQKYGLLEGTSIEFTSSDKTNITRGDMALILYNTYKYYSDKR